MSKIRYKCTKQLEDNFDQLEIEADRLGLVGKEKENYIRERYVFTGPEFGERTVLDLVVSQSGQIGWQNR